jgi:hypothetical protein
MRLIEIITGEDATVEPIAPSRTTPDRSQTKKPRPTRRQDGQRASRWQTPPAQPKPVKPPGTAS